MTPLPHGSDYAIDVHVTSHATALYPDTSMKSASHEVDMQSFELTPYLVITCTSRV